MRKSNPSPESAIRDKDTPFLPGVHAELPSSLSPLRLRYKEPSPSSRPNTPFTRPRFWRQKLRKRAKGAIQVLPTHEKKKTRGFFTRKSPACRSIKVRWKNTSSTVLHRAELSPYPTQRGFDAAASTKPPSSARSTQTTLGRLAWRTDGLRRDYCGIFSIYTRSVDRESKPFPTPFLNPTRKNAPPRISTPTRASFLAFALTIKKNICRLNANSSLQEVSPDKRSAVYSLYPRAPSEKKRKNK